MTRNARRLKIALMVVAGVLMVPLAGYVYETYARLRDARQFPPAGQLVDVGSRKLHVLCTGSGAPTVLFESSGFGNSLSSLTARTALSQATTVCSYDRMGVGWSDDGPGRISVGMLAEDLRALVERAPLERPLLIVASSIGGLTAELFGREHPEHLAGLLLLDAATSETFTRVVPMIESSDINPACSLVWAAGRLGLVRLLDPFNLRMSPSDGVSNALTYGRQPWNTLCAMVRGLSDTRRQFDAAPKLPATIAVTALSAATTDNLAPPQFGALAARLKPVLDQGLRAVAERSTAGVWRVVPGSDHLIAESAPDAVVAAVLEMIHRDRGGSAASSPSASRVH